VAQITRALDECEDARFGDYVLCSAHETQPLAWQPRHLDVRRLPGKRRALHLSWALIGAPRVETLAGRADLFHALDPSIPVPTRLPSICTIHDLMPLQFPDWYPAAHRWAFGRSVRQAARRAAVIVTDSHRVAEDVTSVLGVPPARIRVVYPGVSPEFLVPPGPARQDETYARYGLTANRYFVLVGSVTSRKNLQPVLTALRSVRDTPLLIIGPDGHDAAAVRAEVRRLHIEPMVRFAGYVPAAELPTLLRGALALVHPSSYEGFGFPPLEAMASGTPAIASRAGSLPEVVGEGGLLVDNDDPTTWAEAMMRVRDDADLRDGLIRAGRTQAAKFRWDRAAAETVAIHRAVISDA
jgi:alpha-1,3-rhamnosyl/mannosyltransferase